LIDGIEAIGGFPTNRPFWTSREQGTNSASHDRMIIDNENRARRHLVRGNSLSSSMTNPLIFVGRGRKIIFKSAA
jgi:hypothetical protein